MSSQSIMGQKNGRNETKTCRRKLTPPFSVPGSSYWRKLLPANFSPGPSSVVCRNDGVKPTGTGNRRLEILIDKYSADFSNALTAVERSVVVSNIVTKVQCAAPLGSFVTYENGIWWEVEEDVAHEMVRQLFKFKLEEVDSFDDDRLNDLLSTLRNDERAIVRKSSKANTASSSHDGKVLIRDGPEDAHWKKAQPPKFQWSAGRPSR